MPSMMKAPHSKGMECPMCDGGTCKYAEGGDVHTGKQRMDHEKGVHSEVAPGHGSGMSPAGAGTRTVMRHNRGEGVKAKTADAMGKHAKSEHRRVLSEQKDMPRPTSGRSGFAEGGMVDHKEPDGDEMDPDMELSHGLGKELMGALDSKDHKAVMSALEACVLHCMNKDEPEDEDV